MCFLIFKKYKLIYRLYYWIIYVRNCGIYYILKWNYVFVTWWQTRVCETFSREFVTILFLNNLNLFLRQEYLTYSGLTRPLDELQKNFRLAGAKLCKNLTRENEVPFKLFSGDIFSIVRYSSKCWMPVQRGVKGLSRSYW